MLLIRFNCSIFVVAPMLLNDILERGMFILYLIFDRMLGTHNADVVAVFLGSHSTLLRLKSVIPSGFVCVRMLNKDRTIEAYEKHGIQLN